MGPDRGRTHDPWDLQSDTHLLSDTLPTALHGQVYCRVALKYMAWQYCGCKEFIDHFQNLSIIWRCYDIIKQN